MKKLIRFIFRIKKQEDNYERLVNPKPRSFIKPIYKISFFVGLLLMTGVTKAQISFDMGAGFDFKANVPTARLGVGMEKNNAVMSLEMNCPMTRKFDAPLFLGGSIGYDFKNFIPAIGYYNFYESDGGKKVNKGMIGYSLRYNLLINDNGGLFFEGDLIGSTPQFNTGFHVTF